MNKENHKPTMDNKVRMKQITTRQTWDDLVVSEPVMNSLKEIQYHLVHGKHLKQQGSLGKNINRGASVLFTGEPGTGKTMAASLLGKYSNQGVYKVDVSSLVSKYIGETENNIKKLFEKAESKNWILFFDEADALFGKRSEVKDSHDRYANVEVAYLLQRVEAYSGLVILASNRKTNIDKAFLRRLRYVIDFQRPDVHQRQRLWENLIAKGFKYDKAVDLEKLAKTRALTGGSIVKVLNACMIKSKDRNDKLITNEDIRLGIRIENKK